ncbi:MAG: LON peptidase substrate-binding domain-containing protein [Acidobacteriota bacterium]|nr:LON peptidase substrate-binding domain-containing protein [Acidobacteriota bacterium]
MERGPNAGRLLPLFPLRLVVFPGSATPLHIFEERYREMVGEAAAAGTEFGIVLANNGGIVNSGCTVVVESVLKQYPDGRFDVMTRGQRRFTIQSLNEEKAYLRGAVEYFNDESDEPAPAELRRKAIGAFGQTGDEKVPPEDHPLLSFQLAEAIDDLGFRDMIQRSRSEVERLQTFIEFAGVYIERRQYAAKMQRTAGMNGHGHKRVAE